MARVLRAGILLAVSLSYLSSVFGVLHTTFWHAGLGDWIDPYFINYLLEHWYHSITTLRDPFSPPMFYPAQKTLGYSHGLLLYAPFYVLVRPFFHPFQAYSLSLFIMIETGILCLYVMFRRFATLSFGESLLLTAFFFTSPNVINPTIGVWSQRASVFLIPPILLLASRSYFRPAGRIRLVTAGLSGFLTALLFPHDFYTAYFAVVFAATFLLAWTSVEGHIWGALRSVWQYRHRGVAQTIAASAVLITALWSVYVWMSGGFRLRVLGLTIASRDWRRPVLLTLLSVAVCIWLRRPWDIRGYLRLGLIQSRTHAGTWMRAFGIGAMAGCALFLWIYLPAFVQHPKFPEQDLLDQIRVRSLSRWTGALQDLSAYDTLRSFKLVLILAILAALPPFKVDRQTRWYAAWALGISCVVLVMPIRIDGFSIWLSLFRHLPGFSVIRDPTRIIFLYELAFVVAAGLLLARLRFLPGYRAGLCLLLMYFAVSDYRLDRLGYERRDEVFDRWVEAPIEIDRGCRSFYITAASRGYMSRSPNMWTLYAGDAMFISLKHDLPTLNGYSAWVPEGWELMNPQEVTYAQRVRAWVVQNGLRDVCALDIESRFMRRVSTD